MITSADLEEAIKIYLTVSLSEEATRSVTQHLGVAEVFGRVQPNLGSVVLYWMGECGGAVQVRELVEALVYTQSLGRHTTALCIEQGEITSNCLQMAVCGGFFTVDLVKFVTVLSEKVAVIRDHY